MNENPPSLSAIVVVGSRRERSQRVLNALGAQTIAASLEIIVVDLAADAPQLKTPPGVRTVYLSRPKTEPWARLRAEGLQCANAKVVAFIEDHCFPAPNWAEVLVEAHKGPWAAVGYSFTNANPKTYISRAGMIADYGLWAHPARHGPTSLLPGNNVSYKRDLLLSFGDQITIVLSPDFNIHETFIKRGLAMFVESRALAAHQNFSFLSDLLRANHAYCRLLAASRVQAQSWGELRRIAYGFGVPLGAPVMKFIRLMRSLRGRHTLWRPLVTALPVIALTYFWSAVGESLGYLLGIGDAEQETNRWELEAERTTHA